jgi:hypothetical protein
MNLLIVLSFVANAFSQSDPDVEPCSVDVRWLNTDGNLSHRKSAETFKDVSFLVHLGRGYNCSGAEVAITATYLTEAQEFICSGTIRSALTVSSTIQNFNISFRPFTQNDFVRWRKQPGVRGEQIGKRLACFSLDGTADLGDSDRIRAGLMRVTIGVVPSAGGLGIVEAVFRFTP